MGDGIKPINLGCLLRVGMGLPSPKVTSRQLLERRKMALRNDVKTVSQEPAGRYLQS